MAYIGRGPDTELFQKSFQRFSGDNSEQSFTLERTVVNATDLDVWVADVHQDPFEDYTVTPANNTINFTNPPATGTNNILVGLKDKVAYAVVEADDLSVSTRKLQTDAVTTIKITDSAVTTAKINDSAVTTDKINDDAVTADKLADTTVTAGDYGDESNIPIIRVDAQGRLTQASNVSVNIPEAGINPLLFTG